MAEEGHSDRRFDSEDDSSLREVAHAPSNRIRAAPSSDPLPVAHFRITGRLGSGAMGVLYRDLQPEKVTITSSGLVKLLDFGLAKPAARRLDTAAVAARTEALVTSDERRVIGTMAYMSPEQALGEAVSVQSDVFSFGVLLYARLSGARPFGGPSANAAIAAIRRDAPEPLVGVHAAMAAIVTRCLAKGPTDRFADGRELVKALVYAARAERVTSRPSVAPREPPQSSSIRAETLDVQAAADGGSRGGGVTGAPLRAALRSRGVAALMLVDDGGRVPEALERAALHDSGAASAPPLNRPRAPRTAPPLRSPQ